MTDGREVQKKVLIKGLKGLDISFTFYHFIT